MIVPDANILIYAHDEAAPWHDKARAWWEGALSGTEPVGLAWVVVLAVTRLLTHPTICENPLSPAQVRQLIEGWISVPHVRIIHLSENAPGRFFDLLEEAGTGGNLSTDALIALHALEHSATIVSNDRDFDRFAGVKRINPLV
ncbi:PIN domain-containing protein [Oscillatoria laete-virens NRMC-F 0139]|nr:TA system VapC family ribonuclease toxin [Oscillatoria laete-virens]MDL5054788.1 PIN domain-containing protein [Oscillatoria laete-virens NRMC-F 0139]